MNTRLTNLEKQLIKEIDETKKALAVSRSNCDEHKKRIETLLKSNSEFRESVRDKRMMHQLTEQRLRMIHYHAWNLYTARCGLMEIGSTYRIPKMKQCIEEAKQMFELFKYSVAE